MSKKVKYVFLFILLVLVTVPVSSAEEQTSDQAILLTQADEQKTETAESETKPSESWISNGEDLGKWWLGRAKKQASMPSALLYHLEANYSYSKATGNEKEEQHKINSTLWLRKNIFTSVTQYQFQDKDYGIPVKTPKRKQILDEFIYAELWDKIDLAVGYEWYKYNKRYIDSRHSFFIGPYFTILDSPKFILKAGTYVGTMKTAYMNDDIEAKCGSSYDDYSTEFLFFLQKLNWSITDSITFTESANYRMEFEDMDYYHWKLNFGLNVKLTKHISVVSSYEIEYSSSQVDQECKGSEKKDTDLSIGLQVSF